MVREMSNRRLIRGLGMDDIHEQVEKFAERLRDAPLGTRMIVPTLGLKERIGSMLLDMGTSFVESSVCTLDDLCREFIESNEGMSLIDEMQAGTIVQWLLERNTDRFPLLTMEGEGRSVVPQLRAFMRLLMDYDVDYPSCLGDLQGERSQELSSLTSDYIELLDRGGHVDSSTMKRVVIEHLEEGGSRFDHVTFLGFYEPPVIERELISAISSVARESTLHIPYIGDDSVHQDDGSWFDADQIVDGSKTGEESPLTAGVPPSGIRMSTFRDRIEEARCIAQKVSDLVESGVEQGRIAIMLPVRSRAAPLIGWALEDCGLASDIMLEIPLEQSPLVQTLMDVLEIVSSNHSREAVVRLLRSPFVAFRHGENGRLWGGLVDHISLEAGVMEGREQWTDLLKALKTSIMDEMDSPELPEHAREAMGHKIERIQLVMDGLEKLFDLLGTLSTRTTLGEMVRIYRSVLSKLEVDRRLRTPWTTPGEGASLRGFDQMLEGMERGPLREREVDPERFQGMISLAASSGTYRREGRNENAVQVVGLRGSIFMDYDHVFIPGMVDGEIPFLSAELALSTEQEKRRMGILSRQDMLRQERYYFCHALSLAGEMTYLSAPLSDDDTKLVPSSFFDRLYQDDVEGFEPPLLSDSTLLSQRRMGKMVSGISKPGERMAPIDLDPSLLVGRINVERCRRRGEYDSCFDGILRDGEILEAIGAMHEGRTYSPTMLKTYAECPFSYHMRYVLRIEPPPELEMEISSRDRGTLFHRIAQRFYSSRRERGRTKLSWDEAIPEWDRMMSIAREELARYSFSGPAWNAFSTGLVGSPDRKGLLTAFMDHELEKPITGLDPSHFELSIGVPTDERSDPGSIEDPVSISLGEEDILLRCKIDRVDTGPNGEFFVIDYKTGGIPWLSEIRAGRKLQLPLYLLAYAGSHPCTKGIGGTYYRVAGVNSVGYRSTIGDSFFAPLMGKAGNSKGVNPEFRKLIEDTRWRVSEYVRGMREGKFHPRICNGKCPPYCEYKGICRFNDLRLFEMEGDDATD
jgi:hypothetical protein